MDVLSLHTKNWCNPRIGTRLMDSGTTAVRCNWAGKETDSRLRIEASIEDELTIRRKGRALVSVDT